MDLLAIIRLSDFRETSASPQQQRQMMTDYAASHGHRIIAFVEDTDVSGDFGPFHPKRSIGPWLTDRQGEYDGIICRAINRVARNAEQMLRLLRWAENRKKILISIKDGVDTTTDAGKTMAKFMAVVAEMELDQIKSRAQDGHKHLTQVALRWRGMSVPFGYRPYCIVCGKTTGVCTCLPSQQKGWKLEQDPVYGPILIEMVDRFLEGSTLGQIVQWLNDSGIPTSSDIARIRYGKTPKNAKWATQSVRKILSSHAMLGAMDVTEVLERDDETGRPTKRSERKPLYDENGDLVLRAEPIVSYENWAKVQTRLNTNPQLGKLHVNASPLLRIAYCGVCLDPMYITRSKDRQGNRSFRYYLCNAGNHSQCQAKRFKANELEECISSTVLEYAGAWPHSLPQIIPAEEYSGALAQAEDARNNLLEALEAGAFKGRMDVFNERLNAAEQRITELKDKPSRSAQTIWKPTGKTVKQYWESLKPDERWEYLRTMKVTVFISREKVPRFIAESTDEAESATLDIPYFTIRERDGVHIVANFGTLNELRELATKYSTGK